ncbi:MAG: hypothetical protein M3Q23_17120 [Actinomycetota bacterium]|nr:hypothetical protein [Actinomycetota bacterium]
MADRRWQMSDDQLETALASLGRYLEYPEPDVAAAVVARLTARPAARPGIVERLLPRRPVRRVAVLALAMLVLLSGAAVAGRLGLPGLRIIFQPKATVLPSPPPVGTQLFLGGRTTLERARDQVSFPVEVPRGRHLGPAEVYVSVVPAGGRVSLVYRPHPGLPAARFTGVGALVTEFRGSVNPTLIKKLMASGTKVDFVQVNAQSGFWFSGAPHEIYYTDEHGRPFTDSVRLAGNTLVWVDAELTLRLECRCSEARAIAIASSVR